MPTGYTANLKDMNYNVREWLKTSVSRAFGMCACFRDESSGLNQEQIIGKLSSKDSFYEDALKKSIKELNKFRTAPKETLRAELDKLKKETYDNRQKRIKQFYKDKESHIEVLAELKEMLHKTSDEINLNMLKFAINQIEEALPFDFSECYAERVDEVENMSLETYIEYMISCINADIIRYEKHLKEDNTRNEERLQAYLNLVNFVDSN